MIQVPDAINRYSEVDLWGVTPTSILAANHVLSEPSNPVEAEWSLLRRHYDLWVLRTNYQPPWTVYRDFIADLTKHLLEGPVKQTAIFVDPDQYRQFIAGCLYHNGSDGVIRLLNWAIQQYDPDTPDARIRIHRQDISQYAKQSDIRILTAIQAVAYTSTGYNFDPTVIKSLASGLGRDRGSAATSLLARILGRLGVDAPKDVIPELLAALDYPIPDELTTRPAGNIPIYVLHHSLEPLVNDLFTTTLSQAINDLQDSVANQYASLEEVRRVDFVPSDGASEVPWPLSDQGAAVCAVMSQRGVPVAADWLVEVEADEDIFALHARLQDAGFAVTLQNRLLRFDEAYRAPTPPEQALEEYQAWLDQRTTALRSRSWVLADLENRIERVAEIHRLEITGQSMAVLDEYEISPTTFVYSMLDPDRLKQYSEDRYVGESDHLVDELHWIREWRKEAPVDARPYASVLPEILSYPLEHESVTPELRIMSPWFNFALQDYVALVNRLLESCVQVKMLFRLPTHRQWNRMQSQFFERIGDTHGNLELRTYSRYREYREQSDLAEIEDDLDEYLNEFGVHAKLYIAGDQSNGSLLAGSANLMENSLHFNPEVGVQTHDPNLIATAQSYFDLIWKLSAADTIPEKVMFGEVPFTFYPKVYEP